MMDGMSGMHFSCMDCDRQSGLYTGEVGSLKPPNSPEGQEWVISAAQYHEVEWAVSWVWHANLPIANIIFK